MVARPSAEGASQSATDARFFQSAKRLILLLFINQLPGCPLFQVHERAQRCTAHPRKIHAKQELVGPCEPRAHFDLSVQCPMYRAAICNLEQSLPLRIREVTFERKHSTKLIDLA